MSDLELSQNSEHLIEPSSGDSAEYSTEALPATEGSKIAIMHASEQLLADSPMYTNMITTYRSLDTDLGDGRSLEMIGTFGSTGGGSQTELAMIARQLLPDGGRLDSYVNLGVDQGQHSITRNLYELTADQVRENFTPNPFQDRAALTKTNLEKMRQGDPEGSRNEHNAMMKAANRAVKRMDQRDYTAVEMEAIFGGGLHGRVANGEQMDVSEQEARGITQIIELMKVQKQRSGA